MLEHLRSGRCGSFERNEPRRLSQEFPRFGAELLHAVRTAKVVSLASVLMPGRGRVGLYIHAADRVFYGSALCWVVSVFVVAHGKTSTT